MMSDTLINSLKIFLVRLKVFTLACIFVSFSGYAYADIFDRENCEPIPNDWAPGNTVEWYDFLKMHENYNNDNRDLSEVAMPRIGPGTNESRLMRPRIREVMEDYCLWSQKEKGKWITVPGKNAIRKPIRDQLTGDLDSSDLEIDPPTSSLGITQVNFINSTGVKDITFNRHGCGASVCEYEGVIRFIKKIQRDMFIVAVYVTKFDAYGTVTKIHKCNMRFNENSARILECGNGVTRPAFYENNTSGKYIADLVNARMAKPGVYVGGTERGSASILQAPQDKPVWQTNMGPMAVYRDDTSVKGKHQFIAKWNEHLNGIVKMFTKDGVNYNGIYTRQCGLKDDGSFNVDSRYYRGCASTDIKKMIDKDKNWKVYYKDAKGNKSSCWGQIFGKKDLKRGVFEGFMNKCGGLGKASAQPRHYNETLFAAKLPTKSEISESERQRIAELKAAADAERLRKAAEEEGLRQKRELAALRAERDAREAAQLRRQVEEEARQIELENRRREAEIKEEKRLADEALLTANIGTVRSARGEEVWESDWGPVVVDADEMGNFTARYNDNSSGWISLKSPDGFRYRGYWARICGINEQGCTSRKMSRNRRKTSCWGELWGKVNSRNDEFSGNWNYCGMANTGGQWNGFR